MYTQISSNVIPLTIANHTFWLYRVPPVCLRPIEFVVIPSWNADCVIVMSVKSATVPAVYHSLFISQSKKKKVKTDLDCTGNTGMFLLYCCSNQTRTLKLLINNSSFVLDIWGKNLYLTFK